MNVPKIAHTKFDRRIKLSPQDRISIVTIRETEKISFQKIANRFKISKKMAIFVCHPEKEEACKKARQERGGSKIYYDKDKHRESMQSHRKYKKELLEKGLIKPTQT